MFNIGEQWVADVIELQGLKRWNNGIRYALTMVDVLSKFAWVEPLKNETGLAVTQNVDRMDGDSIEGKTCTIMWEEVMQMVCYENRNSKAM